MNLGFWGKLDKPFTVLAPMEGVTDTVFRRSISVFGRPEVYFSEFTNVHGICSEGFIKVAERLLFTPEEKPIVAQIWGTDPEKFFTGAKVISKMGFDGIDINFGCPVKDVIKTGACAAMISQDKQSRTKVSEIIKATKEGAGKLPVSVKTRIGNKKIITEDWISFLLEHSLAALTIHLRTAAEKSKGPARWEEMEKVMEVVRVGGYLTRIIGNGDVADRKQGVELCNRYGMDGVMIGRGVLTNPAAFARKEIHLTKNKRLEALTAHAVMYQKQWQDKKPFEQIRKSVKMYVSGFDGANQLRAQLMEAKTFCELLLTIEQIRDGGEDL